MTGVTMLVLVATVVMVTDPADPRLDCCARRSPRRDSHLHHSQNGAPVVGRWWWWWWRRCKEKSSLVAR